MIELTSLPTQPTYVYFVASTRTNGLFVSLASLRAISVLPDPVGPFSNKFLGVIYVLISSGRSFRRQRFLKAQATALLASGCPITNLSRYYTSFSGVRSAYEFSRDLNIFLIPAESLFQPKLEGCMLASKIEKRDTNCSETNFLALTMAVSMMNIKNNEKNHHSHHFLLYIS